ncbi:hypothetical protein D3C78_1727930 [compost metagenome]
MGFTVVILLMLAVFISAILKSQYFSEILAFSGTLIGTVLGYYYSARSNAT